MGGRGEGSVSLSRDSDFPVWLVGFVGKGSCSACCTRHAFAIRQDVASAILCYMARVSLGLRLDRVLIDRVDAARGDVPRARWIERAIEARLDVVAGSPRVSDEVAEREGRALANVADAASAERRSAGSRAPESAAMARQRAMNRAKGL